MTISTAIGERAQGLTIEKADTKTHAARRIALETVDPWRPRMVEVRGTGEVIPADDPRKAFIRIHPKRVINFGIE
jgi:hypothetical protein